MAVRVKQEPFLDARGWTCAPTKHEASDAAPAAAVPPLECVFEGCIGGFLGETSRLRLRIASDGELRGEVWRRRPVATGASSAAAIAVSDGAKRRRVEAAAVVKSGGDWLTSDHFLVAHVTGRAVMDKIQSIGSSDGAQASPTAGPFEYCCEFDATKHVDHVDRHTVSCHMHIPAAAGALGKEYAECVADGQWWLPNRRQPRTSPGLEIAPRDSDGVATVSPPQHEPDRKLFQLRRIDPNAEARFEDSGAEAARRSSLYPLRPGKYEFRGFSMYETLVVSPTPHQRGRRRRSSAPPVVTKDECIVSLRLLPDGTLRGTSREIVHPQVCAVHGNWQVSRVIYILEYHVRDAVGHFRYSGGVDTETDKLVGKWRNVDEGHADGYEGGKGEFELELVHVRYDSNSDGKLKREKKQETEPPLEDGVIIASAELEHEQSVETAARSIDDDDEDLAISALTTGTYRLKGEATDSDGYEYAFEFIMTLYPGGKLVGACRERVFEQTRPVTGRWDRTSISYDQEYVVRREVGVYKYTGALSPDGAVVRGHWRNAEDKYAAIRSEHGTFALAMTTAERFWSTYSHRDFPRGFRAAAKCLLLCSARSHALPGALWTHILAFCDEKWFQQCDKGDSKRVDDALECKAEAVLV